MIKRIKFRQFFEHGAKTQVDYLDCKDCERCHSNCCETRRLRETSYLQCARQVSECFRVFALLFDWVKNNRKPLKCFHKNLRKETLVSSTMGKIRVTAVTMKPKALHPKILRDFPGRLSGNLVTMCSTILKSFLPQLLSILSCVYNCDDKSYLHIFLCSLNKLYDILYIFLSSLSSTGILRTHNVTSS